MSRTNPKHDRKTKKSYTLSPESVAFLETLQKKRRAASVSSVLEEILAALRREQQREALERSVTEYYGAISDKEAHEQTEWGAFALREFLNQDRF
jgi:hypothetical protein